MAGTGGGPMTKQEIATFAQKLEAWGQGLTEKEQDFLEEILARSAAASSGEVEGFMTKTERKVPVFTPDVTASWDWGNLPAGRFSGVLLAGQ